MLAPAPPSSGPLARHRRLATHSKYTPPTTCSPRRRLGKALNTAFTPSTADADQIAAPTVIPSAARRALALWSLAASCDTNKTLAPGLIMAAT